MTNGIREEVFESVLSMFEDYDQKTDHTNGPEKTRELTEAFALFMLSVSDEYAHFAYQVMTETMAATYGEFLAMGDK